MAGASSSADGDSSPKDSSFYDVCVFSLKFTIYYCCYLSKGIRILGDINCRSIDTWLIQFVFSQELYFWVRVYIRSSYIWPSLLDFDFSSELLF